MNTDLHNEERKTHLQKEEKLKAYIRDLGSLAVAFSGGVDSTYLCAVAHEVLGDRMIAVTARSESFPEREFREAEDFCRENGIRQLTLVSEELEIEGFRHNPKNRCYLCKKEIFGKILDMARKEGIAYVAEGSNMDDLGDYRPGLQAVAELGVTSPLREAGLTKQEIRDLSRKRNLPTWDKPSFACLASRFVYGEPITKERLNRVGAAEQLLLDLGFRQVRVRIHGEENEMARIEVLPEEIARFSQDQLRQKVWTGLKAMGFAYVTLDLQGYRTGSMNV